MTRQQYVSSYQPSYLAAWTRTCDSIFNGFAPTDEEGYAYFEGKAYNFDWCVTLRESWPEVSPRVGPDGPSDYLLEDITAESVASSAAADGSNDAYVAVWDVVPTLCVGATCVTEEDWYDYIETGAQ